MFNTSSFISSQRNRDCFHLPGCRWRPVIFAPPWNFDVHGLHLGIVINCSGSDSRLHVLGLGACHRQEDVRADGNREQDVGGMGDGQSSAVRIDQRHEIRTGAEVAGHYEAGESHQGPRSPGARARFPQAIWKTLLWRSLSYVKFHHKLWLLKF